MCDVEHGGVDGCSACNARAIGRRRTLRGALGTRRTLRRRGTLHRRTRRDAGALGRNETLWRRGPERWRGPLWS